MAPRLTPSRQLQLQGLLAPVRGLLDHLARPAALVDEVRRTPAAVQQILNAALPTDAPGPFDSFAGPESLVSPSAETAAAPTAAAAPLGQNRPNESRRTTVPASPFAPPKGNAHPQAALADTPAQKPEVLPPRMPLASLNESALVPAATGARREGSDSGASPHGARAPTASPEAANRQAPRSQRTALQPTMGLIASLVNDLLEARPTGATLARSASRGSQPSNATGPRNDSRQTRGEASADSPARSAPSALAPRATRHDRAVEPDARHAAARRAAFVGVPLSRDVSGEARNSGASVSLDAARGSRSAFLSLPSRSGESLPAVAPLESVRNAYDDAPARSLLTGAAAADSFTSRLRQSAADEITGEGLAQLINEALVDQARRNGVDLP